MGKKSDEPGVPETERDAPIRPQQFIWRAGRTVGVYTKFNRLKLN